MKKLDTYLNLCTQVYNRSKPKPPEDAYKFYKSYLEQASGAVLEPMCGTGRYLLPFLSEGWEVEGFDASEYMLKALHEKAKKLGLTPNAWQDYAENFNSKKSYKLIFIPNGSFGLITSLKVISEMLKKLYASLDKGGMLVFEAETLKAMPNQFGASRSYVYKRNDNNMIIATYFDLQPEDNVCTTICRYELVQNNEIIKTEIEELKVRLYDPESLKQQLKHIGFSEVTLCKAYDRDLTSGQDDEVVIYECKK